MNDSWSSVNKETTPILLSNVPDDPVFVSMLRLCQTCRFFLLYCACGGWLTFIILTLYCLTSRKCGILQPSKGQLFCFVFFCFFNYYYFTALPYKEHYQCNKQNVNHPSVWFMNNKVKLRKWKPDVGLFPTNDLYCYLFRLQNVLIVHSLYRAH